MRMGGNPRIEAQGKETHCGGRRTKEIIKTFVPPCGFLSHQWRRESLERKDLLGFLGFSFRCLAAAANPTGSHPTNGCAISQSTLRVPLLMAERKGFEPLKGCYSFNGLANRRLQPLGHLSERPAFSSRLSPQAK